MSYDLVSVNRSNNPIDRNREPDAYYKKECELKNTLNFSLERWSRILKLARLYGWQPAGTRAGSLYYDVPDYPDIKPIEWSGGYFTNDGQIVTADDASELGKALEQALDDLPDYESNSPRYVKVHSFKEAKDYISLMENPILKSFLSKREWYLSEEGISLPNTKLSLFEFFSGPQKKYVIDFITFCKKGAFEIW
jgi:hypothetical protein